MTHLHLHVLAFEYTEAVIIFRDIKSTKMHHLINSIDCEKIE